MFQITYSKKAEKFLRKQDKTTQYRLFTAISKLPLEGNIKKLQGISGYRLRVGNYRVLFDVNGFVVDIIDVGNRGQMLMATLDGNTKTLLPVSELPCILSLIQ